MRPVAGITLFVLGFPLVPATCADGACQPGQLPRSIRYVLDRLIVLRSSVTAQSDDLY
jgi:hypothetical protein